MNSLRNSPHLIFPPSLVFRSNPVASLTSRLLLGTGIGLKVGRWDVCAGSGAVGLLTLFLPSFLHATAPASYSHSRSGRGPGRYGHIPMIDVIMCLSTSFKSFVNIRNLLLLHHQNCNSEERERYL